MDVKVKPSLPIYTRCLSVTIHVGYFQFLLVCLLLYTSIYLCIHTQLATIPTYSSIYIQSYLFVYGDKIDYIHLYMHIYMHINLYIKT
jgi:hypothetical protein